MRPHLVHLTTLLILSLILSACSGSVPAAPSTSTTVGPTATSVSTLAPPFEEIQQTVSQIWSEDKNKSNKYDRWIAYYKTLVGKRVENWHAWVYSLQHRSTGEIELRPLWQDPYTDEITRRNDGCDSDCGDAHFNLVGLTQEQLQMLKCGDEIVFSGVIVPTRNYANIKVEKLDIAPQLTPTPTLPEQLDDFEVTLERTTCFVACPVYSLKLYADGTVIYEGKKFVDVVGRRTYKIEPEKVLALARWVLKVGYFDLGTYNNRGVTDSPSAHTSVVLNGKSKKVWHYHGDYSAPFRLLIFEAKIDEIANTAQWIGNGGRTPPASPTVPSTPTP